MLLSRLWRTTGEFTQNRALVGRQLFEVQYLRTQALERLQHTTLCASRGTADDDIAKAGG